MSDLQSLAELARSAVPVDHITPVESLHRRADDRRRRRRAVAATLGVAVLAVAVGGGVVAERRQGDERVLGTTSSSDPTTANPRPTPIAPAATGGASPAGDGTGSAPAGPGPVPIDDGPPTAPSLPTAASVSPAGGAADASTTTTFVGSPTPSLSGGPPPVSAPPASSPTTTKPIGINPHGITTDGIEPVSFGASVAQIQGVTGQPAVPYPTDVCEPTTTLHIDGLFPGFVMEFRDQGAEGLTDVRVTQPGVTTVSGVGIGTSISYARMTSPNLVERSDIGFPYWILFSADHQRSWAFAVAANDTVGPMVAGLGDVSSLLAECN
jgi:hypothetical protein